MKALAHDALGIEEDSILLFSDIDIDKAFRPTELGYAPFYPHSSWPSVIGTHIRHWCYNSLARKYAADDVKYTRDLYKYFGSPEAGDDDSELACMVGAVRWRGYAIDVPALQKLKDKATAALDALEYNFNSVDVVRRYITEVMDETEKIVLRDSTGKVILEEITKWEASEVCQCSGMEAECPICGGDGLVPTNAAHPAAIRAREVLNARHAKKEIELYNKLITAGRFHASFKVIGTLSSRMSGADGLNAQGIKRDTNVRSCFPLADGGLVLCGGDFAGFEVTLIDAVYKDPRLRTDLQSGKKIHGLFGVYLFPNMTYDEILESKGADDPFKDFYGRSKNGVFALCYGGEAYTLSNRVGITEEIAEKAYQQFIQKYTKFGDERKRYAQAFCSMRQDGGIGTKVEWHEPAEYIESIFGFKRYYTLENMICKTLFNLAEKPPKSWTEVGLRVVRRDRVQTACGALRSALFAASFAVQASNMRSAGNHVIQSSGAQITKSLQRNLWDIQPAGCNAWRVQPMNIHDEIMCPTHPNYMGEVTKVVDTLLTKYRPTVPLIEIDWGNMLNSWADK